MPSQINCAGAQDLFRQPQHSWRDFEQLSPHLKECATCRLPLDESSKMFACAADDTTKLVLTRLRAMGYAEHDIRVCDASGTFCHGPTGGLPFTDHILPLGSGIGDPYTDVFYASTLGEHDGVYEDERGTWDVVLNRNEPWSTVVILARKKDGISLISRDVLPPIVQTKGELDIFPVVLTQAEFVYGEKMSLELARMRRREEVRNIHGFDQFVYEAVISAFDLNGISFRLRPLPAGTKERNCVPSPIVINGDACLTHMERIARQLAPHLSPEERALLDDPRVLARTFFMEGMRQLLS